MKINLIQDDGYPGLKADKNILLKELGSLGHDVQFIYEKRHLSPNDLLSYLPAPQADINLHIEKIALPYLRNAKLNWFIPNPECYTQEVEILQKVDLILCKSQRAVEKFQQFGQKTFFLGFTSFDHLNLNVQKNFRQLFHYQGTGKGIKGTFWVERAWNTDYTLPPLTILGGLPPAYKRGSLTVLHEILPEDKLIELQNRCGIHLCPSAAEGFGHILEEGMSTGAVIITCNAPPMNERIIDPECLLPVKHDGIHLIYNFERLFFYDQRDLVKMVKKMMTWPMEKLEQIGQKNRQTYLDNQAAFRNRLKELLKITKNRLGESD